MQLSDFVQSGWRRHGDDEEGVFAELPRGIELLTEPAQVPQLAGLIVHVAGEHLGRWQDGLDLLDRCGRIDGFDPDSVEGRSLRRSRAILHHCAGDTAKRDRCLANAIEPDLHENSGRVRVLAVASSALLGQKRMDEALAAFEGALDLAEYGPGKDDPAARSLAITGNNTACELEERSSRSPAEDALLLRAAQAGRRYWEIAGSWINVERAEYRLAMTQLALGNPAATLHHGHVCLAVCRAHDADGVEFFFGHEAVAKAWHALGRSADARESRELAAACLERVDTARMREFCAGELAKLDAHLGISESA